VDEEEVRGSSFDDSPGLRFPEELPAEDRRARECLPRLEARFDERLDLPGEVVRAQGSSAKVCPSRNPHAGPVSEVYALDRRSRRRAIRSFPSSPTNRGNVVVCAKEAQERKIARVLTRNVP